MKEVKAENQGTDTALKTLFVPKKFSILPLFKLEPAFVKYTTSIFQSSIIRESLDSSSVAPDALNSGSLFDMSRVKCHAPGAGWLLDGFSTNGMELVLQFKTAKKGVHAASPNVDIISKRGYNDIPVPRAAIQVKESCGRGLFRAHENRSPLRFDISEDWNGRVIAIDPGQLKMLQVVSCDWKTLRDNDSLPNDTIEAMINFSKPQPSYLNGHVHIWNVTNAEYRERTGQKAFATFEGHRRQCFRFKTLLEQIGETSCKTCNCEEFFCYLKVIATHFSSLQRENNRLDRRKMRWITKRKTNKTLDKIASRMLRSSSHRKNKAKEKPNVSNKPMPIVFFGDGNWKQCKGSPPVPRKPLIKRLAARTITVMMDEYRTSKMCPCHGCNSELTNQNSPGNRRVRVCTRRNSSGDGTSGCIVNRVGGIDRDVAGGLSILVCGKDELLSRKRQS